MNDGYRGPCFFGPSFAGCSTFGRLNRGGIKVATHHWMSLVAGVQVPRSVSVFSTFIPSIAFPFPDMTYVGVAFGSGQHISNASINEPNPGINFSQLSMQYNF
ncbi:acyloxyacyl hydrolase [Paraburkholderia sp.]|uniref:acyloxyacyl hydrolase n=1 Tax=Paraburkholderia sp. TaxID=1926495 RepID=UPI0039C9C266